MAALCAAGRDFTGRILEAESTEDAAVYQSLPDGSAEQTAGKQSFDVLHGGICEGCAALYGRQHVPEEGSKGADLSGRAVSFFEENGEKKELSEEEQRQKTQQLFDSLNIMKSNYELNH